MLVNLRDCVKRNVLLPFNNPAISEDDIAEVNDTLRSGHLNPGFKVAQFEKEFSSKVKAISAVAMNSTQAGIHTTLLAQGIEPGDEIITTPNASYAIVSAIEAIGATPVLVDIEPETGNMDVNRVERALTPKTRAICVTHFAGRPLEMRAITDIASRYGLFILDDASGALGAVYRNQPIGTISHATVFNLCPSDIITTGDGSMVTSNSHELTARIRSMAANGVRSAAYNRTAAQEPNQYQITDMGFAYTMNDVQASLGLWQLRKLDEFISARQSIALFYYKALENLEGVQLPPEMEREDTTCSWQYFPVKINSRAFGMTRNELLPAMRKLNIACSTPPTPIHLQPRFSQLYGAKYGDYPLAEEFAQNCILLPISPAMTEQDWIDVAEAFLTVADVGRR